MRMVDIGKKSVTEREAVVTGKVFLKSSVMSAIKQKRIVKGDVLEAAKIAGILAVKKTPDIIPLCHPIPIECVDIRFRLQKKHIDITTTVKGEAKTGVEMEALTATAVSALTIYDMCKPLDKGIIITDIKLIKKTGGKSGTYERA